MYKAIVCFFCVEDEEEEVTVATYWYADLSGTPVHICNNHKNFVTESVRKTDFVVMFHDIDEITMFEEE